MKEESNSKEIQNETLFKKNFESLASRDQQRHKTRTQLSQHFDDESLTMQKSESLTRSPGKDDKSPSAFNSEESPGKDSKFEDDFSKAASKAAQRK